MTDFETDIFSELYALLTTEYSGILVTNDDLSSYTQFPCVSIVEADNFTDTQTLDSSGKENYSNSMFEISVFSNKSVGRKQEAGEIMDRIHTKMIQFGFSRSNRTPISETSYFRSVSRYVAKVSKNNEIFRR